MYGGRGCILEKQENISMLTVMYFYAYTLVSYKSFKNIISSAMGHDCDDYIVQTWNQRENAHESYRIFTAGYLLM